MLKPENLHENVQSSKKIWNETLRTSFVDKLKPQEFEVFFLGFICLQL